MPSNTYSSLWFQLFMPLQTEDSTRQDVAFLARQLPQPRYRRILDLCCGYGRHAVLLAELGYRVTGVDRDTDAIAEAKQQAMAAGQDVGYVVGDMRDLDALPGTFDAVINMWQSFGYFDDATNVELLRQIAGRLTPGGRFIVDMYNRDYFERHQGDTQRIINGVTVASRGYIEGNRWHSLLSYHDDHAARGEDHMEWQIFTPDEFAALAGACGFAPLLVCAWSDEQQTPSPDVARMQIVLEKC